jgi:hypothetical protein
MERIPDIFQNFIGIGVVMSVLACGADAHVKLGDDTLPVTRVQCQIVFNLFFWEVKF